VACWVYTRHVSTEVLICVSIELLAWLVTTLQCVISESWFKEFLRRDLAAKVALRAKRRLLSSFCDAVVRLDPDRRIVEATPKLMHLLCPTTLMSPEELEHVLFSSLLATRSDKDQFAAFVTRSSAADTDTVEGAAPALRVNLHYSAGDEVSAELFHAFSEGMNNELQHLVGIREVRRGVYSPDESQFERNRKSCMPSLPLKSKTNVLSQSSGSNSVASSSHSKRKLTGLNKVRLNINPIDFSIQEYVLCLEDGDLRSCLVGQCAAPVMKWLQEGVNTVIYDEKPCLKLASKILFRPPTAACASSKVILCAESIALTQSSRDCDVDDDDDDVSEPSWTIDLEFCDISQMVSSKPKARSQTSCRELTVHEATE